MRRTMLAGLALALTVAGADAASAQERPRERPSAQRQDRMERRGMRDGGMAILFKDIQLTADQKSKIEELRKQRPEANREKFQEQRERMRAARESGDTAQLRQMRAAMMKRGQEQQQQHLAQIRDILTPAQRTQFDRNVAEMRERMETRRARAPRGEAGEHRGPRAKPSGVR